MLTSVHKVEAVHFGFRPGLRELGGGGDAHQVAAEGNAHMFEP